MDNKTNNAASFKTKRKISKLLFAISSTDDDASDEINFDKPIEKNNNITTTFSPEINSRLEKIRTIKDKFLNLKDSKNKNNSSGFKFSSIIKGKISKPSTENNSIFDKLNRDTTIKNRIKDKSKDLNKKENYCFVPWSRPDLLKRLFTFSISKWRVPFPNTIDLSAPQFAMSGWECIDTNTLECSLCHIKFTLYFPKGTNPILNLSSLSNDNDNDNDNGNNNDKSIDSYKSLKKSVHTDLCLWKSHPVNPQVYSIPLIDYNSTINLFFKRMDSFLSIDLNFIPNCLVYPSFPFDIESTSYKIENNSNLTIKEKANIMAAFGWLIHWDDSIKDVKYIYCETCFRKVPLRQTMTNTNLNNNNNLNGNSESTFDTISEHQWYCPWINEKFQVSEKPAWVLLAKIMRNYQINDNTLEILKEKLSLSPYLPSIPQKPNSPILSHRNSQSNTSLSDDVFSTKSICESPSSTKTDDQLISRARKLRRSLLHGKY